MELKRLIPFFKFWSIASNFNMESLTTMPKLTTIPVIDMIFKEDPPIHKKNNDPAMLIGSSAIKTKGNTIVLKWVKSAKNRINNPRKAVFLISLI